MNFLKMIDELIYNYGAAEKRTCDRAVLYGTYYNAPPLAKHIIFNPMPPSVKQAMIDNYKLDFPNELLDLYSSMNGANLFWSVRFVGKSNMRVPFNYLSIYGIPITNDRKHIEPYNISIEDLNRPKGTPDSWLKFGSYTRPEDIYSRLDLFVDTRDKCAYAVEHDRSDCCIAETWSSIDDCLCCLLDLLNNM